MSIIYDRALNATVKAREIILNLGPKLNTFSVFDIKFHSKVSKAVSNSSKRTFSLFVYQFRIRCNRSFSNFNSRMSFFCHNAIFQDEEIFLWFLPCFMPWQVADIFTCIGVKYDYWKGLFESVVNQHARVKGKKD